MSADPDIVLIDIEKTEMTLGEVMACIENFNNDAAYSGYDIFLDGDRHAIVARPKV